MKIIPAIIANDIDDLNAKLDLTASFSNVVQIDFFDGRFVPGYFGPSLEEIVTTKSPSLRGPNHRAEAISKVPAGLELIAHILAFRPLAYLPALKAAGFSRVIFHLEADDSPHEVINEARALGLKVGVGVNPATAPGALFPPAGLVDEVLFLGVDPKHPGVFIPQVLDKVDEMRESRERRTGNGVGGLLISVDGGVSAGNIGAVRKSGADVVYVGNAIFGQGDPAANYLRLTAT